MIDISNTRLAEEDAVSGSREWMAQAACAEPYAANGYDAWFGHADDARDEDGVPLKTSVIPREYRRVAMGYCLVCPVKQECLNYAMENDIRHGIWGGKAPEDRTRLRKAREARA
jgi:hypothetical protein